MMSYLIRCVLLTVMSYSMFAQDMDSLFYLTEPEQPDTVRLEANRSLGYHFFYDRPDSSRLYLNNGLSLAKKLSDTSDIASFTNLIGATYYLNGQYTDAMSHYIEAMKWSSLDGDDRYTGIINNNMGAVHFEMGDFDQARNYYTRAIELFEIAQDTFWLSNGLNNLGNALEKMELFEPALETYLYSLKLAKQTNNIEAIGSAYSNLGNIYLGLNDLDSAVLNFKEGLEYQLQSDNPIGVAICYNNIGSVYSLTGRAKEAIELHQKALEIAQKLQNPVTIMNAKKWMSQAYESMGNYKKAYSYYKAYTLVEDSLSSVEKSNDINELQEKYQSARKEQAITELELEKKNAALALVESENLRNLLIGGTIVLFAIAVFLQYRYRTKKRFGDELSRKNHQITEALEERELLLKEIHHRVKNNLQIISSLLKLQAESLSDDAADAVREGENRVKSMSLIHQRLYTADDVRGVDLNDYFERLFEELFAAFGIDQDRIVYKISTNRLKLDIDTVIPLGLILNELVTNALKYAFDADQQGTLSLEIKESNQALVVWLSDDGKGVDAETIEQSNSFGWKMIRSLSRKIKANIEVESDHGTTVQLQLNRYKLVS